MSEETVSMGNLYEMNKSILAKANPLKKHEIKDGIRQIAKAYTDAKYYMLLCRELYDFTIFNLNDNDLSDNKTTFITDLYECLTNRGEVLSIEKDTTGEAFEIWIKTEEDLYAYYFFPYDLGVIEVERKDS